MGDLVEVVVNEVVPDARGHLQDDQGGDQHTVWNALAKELGEFQEQKGQENDAQSAEQKNGFGGGKVVARDQIVRQEQEQDGGDAVVGVVFSLKKQMIPLG